MYFQSKQAVIGQPLLDALLGCLGTRPAGALLTTPTAHLFTAGPTNITPLNVPADFTEASFNGYAAVTLGALSVPVNLPPGGGRGEFVNANFVGGSGLVPPGQTVKGYWIDDTSTHMYLAEIFPAPLAFSNPGDFLDLVVMFALAFSTLANV